MANPTVRLSPHAYGILKELARSSGESMQVVLDRAVEEERRRRFFAEANASYARLRGDVEAWAEYEKDLSAWDTTEGSPLPRLGDSA